MSALNVYGQTHSPWVQAVLLGATEKKLDHQLATATPLSTLTRWGVTMPTARFEGEDWMLESHDILQHMGYSSLEKTQRHKIQAAWQGVLHRTDSAWMFLHEFSLAGDPSPGFLRRTLQNFFRSFSSFYFFLLIRTMALVVKPPQPEDFGEQFLHWEAQLNDSEGEFLGGTSPDTEDFLLYGVIQCHCSVPVPPTETVNTDPRLPGLRAWIIRMQERLPDYPYHYSANYFGDRSQLPSRASKWDQLCFWLGLATWTMTFPISIPAILLCRSRTPK